MQKFSNRFESNLCKSLAIVLNLISAKKKQLNIDKGMPNSSASNAEEQQAILDDYNEKVARAIAEAKATAAKAAKEAEDQIQEFLKEMERKQQEARMRSRARTAMTRVRRSSRSRSRSRNRTVKKHA